MAARSLREAQLLDYDELLRMAGHTDRQVIEQGPLQFIPSCGCGYSGRIVATDAAGIDSLIHHLDDARRRLIGNATPRHAGNVQQRRAKMCNRTRQNSSQTLLVQ